MAVSKHKRKNGKPKPRARQMPKKPREECQTCPLAARCESDSANVRAYGPTSSAQGGPN